MTLKDRKGFWGSSGTSLSKPYLSTPWNSEFKLQYRIPMSLIFLILSAWWALFQQSDNFSRNVHTCTCTEEEIIINILICINYEKGLILFKISEGQIQRGKSLRLKSHYTWPSERIISLLCNDQVWLELFSVEQV